MADLIIKPATGDGNKLILQDKAGGAVLTTADSGATIANATLTTPTLTTPVANMLKLTPTATASAPAGVEGALYYDSDKNSLMAYNGTYWRPVWTHEEKAEIKFPYANIAAFQLDKGVSLFHMDDSPADATGENTYTSTTGTVNNSSSVKKVGTHSANFGYGGTSVNYWQYDNFYRTGTTAFGTVDRTAAMWVKKSATSSEPTFLQIGNHVGGTGMLWAVGGNSSGYGRLVTIGTDATWTDVVLPSDGTWFHVAWAQQNEFCSMYFNGQLVSREDCNGTPNTNSAYLLLGNGNWNSATANKYCAAYLDEVAIWDRALSDSEISNLYSAGGQVV
jgi:hypothetical protein